MFANLATAEFRCSTPTINRSRSLAGRAQRRASLAIRGVWRSTLPAIFTWRTRRIIGCRNSCDEIPIHPSLLLGVAGPSAGVGALVRLEERCAGRPLAAFNGLGGAYPRAHCT